MRDTSDLGRPLMPVPSDLKAMIINRRDVQAYSCRRFRAEVAAWFFLKNRQDFVEKMPLTGGHHGFIEYYY